MSSPAIPAHSASFCRNPLQTLSDEYELRTTCMSKLLRISYLEHKNNGWVRSKINFLVRPQEPLLATVKRRKVAWLWHVTRHGNLSRTILQGTLQSWLCRGQQKKYWMTTSKGGHPCPCQNCSQGPPAEKTGR